MISQMHDHKSLVSLQAFVEELQNWQLTLSRQQKKLRSLRSKMQEKILLNQLEILITQIDSQLLRYRKLRDPSKIQSMDVIVEYNQNSKKFMECMENIGTFVDKVSQYESFGAINQRVQNTNQLNMEIRPNFVKSKLQNQTFSFTVSKQDKGQKLPNTKNYIKGNKKSSIKNKLGKTEILNKTSTSKHSIDKRSNYASTSDEIDSWEVRYQLKEIKSLMTQIQNEIKYHNHEDVQVELSKLHHNNKKMSLQLKSLKQDSQYILARIQKLKEQLATQKQIQSQMIQQFENPQQRSKRSRVQSIENSRTKHPDGVSEWVKMRI